MLILSAFLCSSFRDVRGVRLPDPAGAQADAVHDPGVPAQPHVRRRLLGVVHHQAGSRARQDGAPRHALHRAHQHFQQRPVCATNR